MYLFVVWYSCTHVLMYNAACVIEFQFEKVMVLPGHEDWIRGLEFTSDGNVLSSSNLYQF